MTFKMFISTKKKFINRVETSRSRLVSNHVMINPTCSTPPAPSIHGHLHVEAPSLTRYVNIWSHWCSSSERWRRRKNSFLLSLNKKRLCLVHLWNLRAWDKSYLTTLWYHKQSKRKSKLKIKSKRCRGERDFVLHLFKKKEIIQSPSTKL